MLLQIHQPNVAVIFLFPATYEPWNYQDITLEISTEAQSILENGMLLVT
jgi:hypothetical protein